MEEICREKVREQNFIKECLEDLSRAGISPHEMLPPYELLTINPNQPNKAYINQESKYGR